VVVVGAVVIAAALLGVYLTWIAKRLDRLHVRLDAAATALISQLDRRASAVETLARHSGGASPVDGTEAERLLAAVAAVRDSGGAGRVSAENSLTLAIRRVIDPHRDELVHDAERRSELEALDEARTTVALAQRFHSTAVDDALILRRRRTVRLLGLAGHAPMPEAWPLIDDTPTQNVASPLHDVR
jgi:hypothetical protein